MRSPLLSTLLLLLLTVSIAGWGYYQVEVVQPAELERIEEAKQVARLQQAQTTELLAAQATSEEQADQVLQRWHARYKFIPARMETPDVVQYLEGLSSTGFEQFSVSLASRGATKDYSYYVFDIKGTAFYSSLYSFVWHIENNREFYQIDNLDISYTDVFKTNEVTGEQRRLEMVNFSMKLKGFFAGTDGLSAPADSVLEFPSVLLPASTPAHNSFYPIVREELPPNDELLVDVQDAKLVSIVGDRAIFETKEGQFVLREGDPVYLGTIVKIDPVNIFVRASLNMGGKLEVVDLHIVSDDYQVQSRGADNRLAPIETDSRD